MVISPDFWAGRRVLITGHTGFKGSWLTLWLKSFGADVLGYSLQPPSSPSLFEQAAIRYDIADIRADITDLGDLKTAFIRHKPEIVFHLAAQSLVRYSYAEPVETYMTNVMGTVNLLQAIKECGGVRAAVIVTSDKCYENNESQIGYVEADRLGGHDPYSSSKACAELVAASYRNAYFPERDYAEHQLGIATARAGNVIGGGDWAQDRLLPDLIRGFIKGEVVPIRNPHAVRPWQHVLEPLAGYLLLAQRLFSHGDEFSGAWNFGPDQADVGAVEWIAEDLARRWGGGKYHLVVDSSSLHETNCLKLNNEKAKTQLGWRPKWDLPSALDKIVAWHKAQQNGSEMRAVCLRQLEEYQNR